MQIVDWMLAFQIVVEVADIGSFTDVGDVQAGSFVGRELCQDP